MYNNSVIVIFSNFFIIVIRVRASFDTIGAVYNVIVISVYSPIIFLSAPLIISPTESSSIGNCCVMKRVS